MIIGSFFPLVQLKNERKKKTWTTLQPRHECNRSDRKEQHIKNNVWHDYNRNMRFFFIGRRKKKTHEGRTKSIDQESLFVIFQKKIKKTKKEQNKKKTLDRSQSSSGKIIWTQIRQCIDKFVFFVLIIALNRLSIIIFHQFRSTIISTDGNGKLQTHIKLCWIGIHYALKHF